MVAAHLSPRIHTILKNRGIEGADLEHFLNPDYSRDCHNALNLFDSERMAERVLAAVDSDERIAVYADFDCDGIPAAVVMHDLFRLLGYSNVEYYIPDRDAEGFGFHKHAVDVLKERGVSLILTVDVGAAAPETVRHAQSLGVDVIVTDHHEFSEPSPAYACIHPHRAPYEFPYLCGAGVAFKCAQAVIQYGAARNHVRCTSIRAGMEKWMLDMVALATVADMVPLVGENRCLVHFGLQVLRKSKRPGIRHLCKVARVAQKTMTEDDIGFGLAPRINAASRMSSPHLAFELLTTTDESRAQELAQTLDALNTKRKATTASLTKQIKKRVGQMTTLPQVLVLGSSDYKPALLGSVATALVQTYKRPVCLWGREQSGVLKGSARTDGSVSVVTLLAGAGEALLYSGGHDGAGGFAINEAFLHTLEQALCDSYTTHAEKRTLEEDYYEEIASHEMNAHFLSQLDLLRPFGEGNPKPLWVVYGTTEHVRAFGKEKNHTEILLSHENGKTTRAYQFFCAPEELSVTPIPKTTIGLIGTLERNAFKMNSIELRISKICT